MIACTHCHADIPASAGRVGFIDGGNLCLACHRAEIEALLRGADLDREEMGKLRRRIEDVLRKNPGVLMSIAVLLASDGFVNIDDLV